MGYGREREWPECELRVFYRLCLLNLALAGGGIVLIGASGCGGFYNCDLVDIWLVVFALPVYAAFRLGWDTPAILLMCLLNPLVYGAMWYVVWRMSRLLRSKTTEGDSPPLHNE